MEGLLLLSNLVGTEKRPLSWVVGPQSTSRPAMPCLRDQKRDQRRRTTELRSPETV
jgi:NADH-quinone oxidoreductase subunit B